eukprot:570947-Rhodomonas_salina.1
MQTQPHAWGLNRELEAKAERYYASAYHGSGSERSGPGLRVLMDAILKGVPEEEELVDEEGAGTAPYFPPVVVLCFYYGGIRFPR